MASNPGFVQGTNIRVERLASGESRRISPLALEPNDEFSDNLNETERASG